MHTLGVSLADYLELERRINLPVVTPLFAGIMTGAIYKSTKGPRAIGVAAVAGGAISCVYWYGNMFINDVVFKKGGKF